MSGDVEVNPGPVQNTSVPTQGHPSTGPKDNINGN